MPWSSQIYIGVPIKDFNHAVKLFKRFDVQVHPHTIRDQHWGKLESTQGPVFPVIVNGLEYDLTFGVVLAENGTEPEKEAGYDQMYSTLFGVNLTGRYGPKVIDRVNGNTKRGRSDPFVLDLVLLDNIKQQVNRKYFAEAEIMVMDVFY